MVHCAVAEEKIQDWMTRHNELLKRAAFQSFDPVGQTVVVRDHSGNLHTLSAGELSLPNLLYVHRKNSALQPRAPALPKDAPDSLRTLVKMLADDLSGSPEDTRGAPPR